MGAFDAWVVKLDQHGNILWQRTFGGRRNDGLTDIVEASHGSFIAVGGTASFGNGPLDISAWMFGLDNRGNPVRQKTYGCCFFTSIILTTNGNFLLAGTAFGSDGAFLKIDGGGNIVWQRTYGGPRDDIVFSLRQTFDGGFVGAGLTKSFGVTGEEGSGDAWILRLDSQGHIRGQCHQRGHPKEVGTDTRTAYYSNNENERRCRDSSHGKCNYHPNVSSSRSSVRTRCDAIVRNPTVLLRNNFLIEVYFHWNHVC